MHKLGFYIQNSTVEFLREALGKVKPPVILYHIEGGRGLLEEIRRELAPDAFIIGRWFVEVSTQDAWLDSPDPAARGRELADKIIGYDFEFTFQKGTNGRRLVDAWMSLNEAPFGPASFAPSDTAKKALFEQRARACDRLQVAFWERLQSRGLEAVAFNFAAGNYIRPEHYLNYFEETLKRYKYLGFHEYGWPSLKPGGGVSSGALLYRTCMEGIRAKYGEQHEVIITEAGLARSNMYPADGNIGWLNHKETLSQDRYWESLNWYHSELCKDSYAKGACLYQVGHGGNWDTFRHLGKDNQGAPILLMDKIAQLTCGAPPPPPPSVESLCQRVRAIKDTLAPVSQISDDFATQVARLVQLLPVPLQPGVRISAATQVTDLSARVGRLEAAWSGYATRPGVTAAEAAAVKQTLATLRNDFDKVKSAANKVTIAAAQADDVRAALAMLAADARSLAPTIQKAKELWKTALALEPRVCGSQQPAMQDLRGKLPQHPTLRYPPRATAQIKRVVVHHTVTAPDVAPDRIAQSQVNGGKPGVTYHFLVAGNGTIYWTQSLETVTDQTLQPTINAEAVGVALAGNFTSVAPPDEQLAAASQLIAWLLNALTLPTGAVAGRSEFDKTVGSPGAQWMSGAKYRDRLLEAVKVLSP